MLMAMRRCGDPDVDVEQLRHGSAQRSLMPLEIVFGVEAGEKLVGDAELGTAFVADERQLDARRRFRPGGVAMPEFHLDRACQQHPQRFPLLSGPRLELAEEGTGDVDGGSDIHKHIKAYPKGVVKPCDRSAG